MTNEQLKQAINNQWPFFGVSEQGDVLARYIPCGPVFRWRWNQMIPLPVQGSDLCWLLQSAAEEGHSIGDTDPAKSPGE